MPSASRSQGGFFYCEDALRQLASDWSRDELAVYLLHCRGYTPRYEGSKFGAHGASLRLGIPESGYHAAMSLLEARGVVVRGQTRSGGRPLTTLRRLCEPVSEGTTIRDGHCYSELAERTCLIKMPWVLIDSGLEPEAPSLRHVRSTEGLLRLLSLYLESDARGYIVASGEPGPVSVAGLPDLRRAGLLRVAGTAPDGTMLDRLVYPLNASPSR